MKRKEHAYAGEKADDFDDDKRDSQREAYDQSTKTCYLLEGLSTYTYSVSFD